MADQLSDKVPATGLASLSGLWRQRLAGRRAMLLGILAVFAVFLVIGSLTFVEAALGFIAIALVALLLPTSVDAVEPVAEGEFAAGPLDEHTVQIFADALADPCLVLDRRSLVVYRNAAAAMQFASVSVGNPIAFSLRNPALLTAIDAARRTGVSQTIELHQTIPQRRLIVRGQRAQ